MTTQLIPVYDDIDIPRVAQDLNDVGVVVVLTSRAHAIAVASQVSDILGVNEESEFSIIHLSFEVDDRGWEDCLMYTKVAEFDPGLLRPMTIGAVRAWVAAAEPARYVHSYKYSA